MEKPLVPVERSEEEGGVAWRVRQKKEEMFLLYCVSDARVGEVPCD